MMRRAVPLLVNVLVVAFAGLRLHEIFRGNVFPVPRLHRAGEKFAAGPVAFAVHGFAGHTRICDAVAVLPGQVAGPPGTGGEPVMSKTRTASLAVRPANQRPPSSHGVQATDLPAARQSHTVQCAGTTRCESDSAYRS